VADDGGEVVGIDAEAARPSTGTVEAWPMHGELA
jgi:hypothetical protein